MKSQNNKITNYDSKYIINDPWLRWGVLIGIYALVVLYTVGWEAASDITQGRPIAIDDDFIENILFWSIWLVLTPWVIRFARKFRLERKYLIKSILAHLIFLIVVSAVQYLCFRFGRYVLMEGLSIQMAINEIWLNLNRVYWGVFRNIYRYWAIVGTYYAIDYFLKYRDRERVATELKLKASNLETQLVHAQLATLRMQLQPHFLFNTLNTISVLMEENVEKANLMLVRLSQLLRIALDKMEVHEVPLEQEIAFLQRYLDIEQIRFEDRLKIHLEVDLDVNEAIVPNLILQPIVENAIRHGISKSASASRIEVRSCRKNDQLLLEVFDDGPGIRKIDKNNMGNKGIGLQNTRKRLGQLYGDDYSFDLSSLEGGGGTLVKIMIPFRTKR